MKSCSKKRTAACQRPRWEWELLGGVIACMHGLEAYSTLEAVASQIRKVLVLWVLLLGHSLRQVAKSLFMAVASSHGTETFGINTDNIHGVCVHDNCLKKAVPVCVAAGKVITWCQTTLAGRWRLSHKRSSWRCTMTRKCLMLCYDSWTFWALSPRTSFGSILHVYNVRVSWLSNCTHLYYLHRLIHFLRTHQL